MASNHPASSVRISKRKQKERKYLTIAEKMQVLYMKKKGESSPAIARHFGVSRIVIFDIKNYKDGGEYFNMPTKKSISYRYKPLLLVKTALVTWIEDCR